MEAPDKVTCVCGVKWRRKPGVAGYQPINSASALLVSLNPLTAIKKVKVIPLTPERWLYGVYDIKGVISRSLVEVACC
ncbi:hypothetical protein EAN91_03250 [Klebsiella pneumoniae]|nr:hypothetical protein EAN91_03250 [Klebsiella pneumoniae]